MNKQNPTTAQIKAIKDIYSHRFDELDFFRKQVVAFFEKSYFHEKPLPLVHSIKSRVKDIDHLVEKIKRKWSDVQITEKNLFEKVTDMAGVRVLHLHTKQFEYIHRAIMEHISQGNWVLHESPIAYSWDPEVTTFFKSIGLKAKTKESYYTSIHYVVKPHKRTDLTCEIQIRTLFEEIWGEIDHTLNYPNETTNLACKEQLRVLAKLASTGTRLADSIFKISNKRIGK